MSDKENNIADNLDILKEFNIKEEIEKLQNEKNETVLKDNIINEENTINSLKSLNIKEEIKRLQFEADKKILETNTKEKVEEDEKNLQKRTTKRVTKRKHQYILSWIIFASKYMITSALIFAVLLVTTNYSAYINIAKSYINSNEMEVTQQRLITSVEASNIKEKYTENAKVKIHKKEQDKLKNEEDDTKLSINKMKKEQDKKDINLNIQITPYSNRIIIPKIWKNIPLIDIKNKNISWENELNDIFMKELESWVIRYPGSAKPWKKWTSFIFWHSSNYPWIKWDYNDVFALLDNVSYDDEIIVYYWQEKYKYKVKEKKVIKPWDVSVLWRNKDKSEITLMTCWPVGTTLNRLIVVWDLIKE